MTRDLSTPRRILVGVGAAWLVMAVVLIWLGIADGELVCDDAYYYYEICRNVARGEGFTFDGLQATNGFHPLWAWVLVPVFLVFPASAWVPIHVALTLSAVCVVGSAICVFLVFERHRRPEAGLATALLWLFNPFTWVLCGRGVEGPLNTLCIAGAFLFLDSVRSRGRYTIREAASLGALLGVCLLARTDNVLLCVAFGLVLLVDVVRRGHGWRAGVTRGGSLIAAASLVISPWVVWNLVTFGSVVQTSFRAKSLFELYGRLPPLVNEAGTGAAAGALRNLWLVVMYNARYIAGDELREGHHGWPVFWFYAAVAAAVVLLLLVFRRRKVTGPGLGPIALFCAFHFAWYAWGGRSYFNWYFLPPALGFCLWAGDGLGRAWSSRNRPPRIVVGAVVVAVALSAPVLAARHVKGWEARQDEREFLEGPAALTLSGLPAGTRAGIWNAGRVGYFASFHFPDRYVINLDGVVNNEIPLHVRHDPYESYILENIEWLLEHPSQLQWFVGGERALEFIGRHLTQEGEVFPEP